MVLIKTIACRIRRGFTLVEMMVVISILGLVLAILLPALGAARTKARDVINTVNQRDIANDVTSFSFDNNDFYPESVATIGLDDNWRWQEPRLIIGFERRTAQTHRAMSEYLSDYSDNPDKFQSPNIPYKFKQLEQAWAAGDQWDNPLTPMSTDPMLGTYNYLWNYKGYLPEFDNVFNGPRGSSNPSGHSDLLITDYFGYDHWLNPTAFSSCKKIPNGSPEPETWVAPSYWSKPVPIDEETLEPLQPIELPEMKFTATFIDTHVEKFSLTEATSLQVSITPDGSTPYPEGLGVGDIILPREGLR